MSDAPLSQKKILRFFLPLALSWIFMATEAPISIGVISRMAEPEVNTAAFLLMMGLALWIESPVIDLLSTSTTLAKGRRSYASMVRFALSLMAWVTFAHFVAVFTPLYGTIVYGIMGAPKEVGEAARVGLMAMLPWSGLIGWRRTLQGMLIRTGNTRLIGFGTALRVTTMTVTATSLYYFVQWDSIKIAATSLILSVLSEALFIHVAGRNVLRDSKLLQGTDEDDEVLETRGLLAFHLPLTATTMVGMLTSPLIAAALARTHDAIHAMAAFQVANTLLFLFRTTTFALPEVVITLSREQNGTEAMRRFCSTMGAVLAALLLTFALTPIDDMIFQNILGVSPDIAHTASSVLLLSSATPLIGALQGYIRGMLTTNRLTIARTVATAIAVATLAATLWLGVIAQWPGTVVAAVSVTVAISAELAVLSLAWHLAKSRLAIQPVGG